MPYSKHEAKISAWDPARRLEYERTLLRLAVASRIENLLDGLTLRRSDLAKRIGKSAAWVSKLLSGNQNLTVDTLAEIGWALGVRWDVQAFSASRENTPASSDGPLPEWVRQESMASRQTTFITHSVDLVSAFKTGWRSACPWEYEFVDSESFATGLSHGGTAGSASGASYARGVRPAHVQVWGGAVPTSPVYPMGSRIVGSRWYFSAAANTEVDQEYPNGFIAIGSR